MTKNGTTGDDNIPRLDYLKINGLVSPPILPRALKKYLSNFVVNPVTNNSNVLQMLQFYCFITLNLASNVSASFQGICMSSNAR